VGGFGDPERTLEIMKDPTCGPMGVLSLIVVCLLKFAALYVLLEQHLDYFLLIFPVLGRCVPLFLFLTTQYVREKGLGSSLTDYLPKVASWMVFVITLSFLCLYKWLGFLVFICFIFLLIIFRSLFVKRIGGITGDTVGATIELVETGLIMTVVIGSFYI